MEDTLDLNKIWLVFRKYIFAVIISAILTGAAAFSAAEFLIAKVYESSAMLYVENNQNNNDTLNINDITAAQKLVNTCQIIFQSNTMLNSVIFELDLPYTADELKEMISVSSVNGTEVMRITAKNEDPERAADIVNVLVQLAQDEFMRVIKSGSIEVVEYGEVAKEPYFPNPVLFLMAGIAMGAVAAYVIAFIKDMLNVTVSEKDDLSKIYNVPVFAEIMDFENLHTDKYGYSRKQTQNKKTKFIPGKRFLLDEDTPFVISEAYREARTNIIFSLAASGKNVISFTSAEPGEGKSTTCANMSIAFSDMGKRILLIDCDMRKPTVQAAFKLNTMNGLSSVLGGFCSLDDAIVRNVKNSLDVLTSGQIPPNPTELLSSVNMTKLLENVSSRYDYVLLDTPPVNVVTDSQLMNSSISGHVIVVKENSTSHPDIADALGKIDLAQGKKLGFIKSFCCGGMKTSKGSKNKRYSRYQSYGYEYKSNNSNNASNN